LRFNNALILIFIILSALLAQDMAWASGKRCKDYLFPIRRQWLLTNSNRSPKIDLSNLISIRALMINRDPSISKRRKLELAGLFTKELTEVLDKLGIKYQLVKNPNSKAKDIYVLDGPGTLGKMIRALKASTGAQILFSPYFFYEGTFYGLYEDDKMYIALESILRLSENGTIENFMTGTDNDLHEFKHARLHAKRRDAGRDDNFDFWVKPKKQDKRLWIYNDIFMEELPIYLQDMSHYLKALRKSGDFNGYPGTDDFDHLAYYFENTIQPFHSYFTELIDRALPALLPATVEKIKSGTISIPGRSVKIYEGHWNGYEQIIVEVETASANLHIPVRNKELVAKFQALKQSKPSGEEINEMANIILSRVNLKTSNFKSFLDPVGPQIDEALRLNKAIKGEMVTSESRRKNVNRLNEVVAEIHRLVRESEEF
jgi:hypothetical protein